MVQLRVVLFLAIKDEVNIPVKYIGLGEGENDLQSFDIEKIYLWII